MPPSAVLPRRANGVPERVGLPLRYERLTITIAQADPQERESLTWLLELEGYKVFAYASADELLQSFDLRLVGCLLIDLQLPDLTGMELLRLLRKKGCRQPALFTAESCLATVAVDLLRSGAVDLLVKPWSQERLTASVAKASRQHQRWTLVQNRIDRLSGREQEILELVIAGLPTKQIARLLNISPRTVDVHRSNIVKKLEVSSFAGLVQTITRHEMSGI